MKTFVTAALGFLPLFLPAWGKETCVRSESQPAPYIWPSPIIDEMDDILQLQSGYLGRHFVDGLSCFVALQLSVNILSSQE